MAMLCDAKHYTIIYYFVMGYEVISTSTVDTNIDQGDSWGQ